MKLIKLILAGVVAMTVSACSEDAPVNPEVDEPEIPEEVVFELSEGESRAAEGLADFGLNLFECYNNDAPTGENVVLSPLSASILLSMIANGTGPELAGEITDVLGTTDLENLNSLNYRILNRLPMADTAVDIDFANSLWYRNSLSVRNDFKATLVESFAAEINGMDFDDEAGTIRAINSWVYAKTNGKIGSIINEITPQSLAILANAMVFSASWSEPFKESDTKTEIFHGSTSDANVPMMHLEKKQHYHRGDNFKALKREMGFGSLEAIFILPDEDVDIDDFVLHGGLRQVQAIRYWNDQNVIFSMPRFETQGAQAVRLNESFRDMGIEHIGYWDNQRIFNENVAIFSSIYQKNSLKFTEVGAEGASVTYVHMQGALGDSQPKIPEIHLNRPFLFSIYSPVANAYLYIGKIVNL